MIRKFLGETLVLLRGVLTVLCDKRPFRDNTPTGSIEGRARRSRARNRYGRTPGDITTAALAWLLLLVVVLGPVAAAVFGWDSVTLRWFAAPAGGLLLVVRVANVVLRRGR